MSLLALYNLLLFLRLNCLHHCCNIISTPCVVCHHFICLMLPFQGHVACRDFTREGPH